MVLLTRSTGFFMFSLHLKLPDQSVLSDGERGGGSSFVSPFC